MHPDSPIQDSIAPTVTGLRQAPRTSGTAAAVAWATPVLAVTACGAPSAPNDSAVVGDGERYALQMTIRPEVVDRASGRVRHAEEVRWSGEATNQGGHFVNIRGTAGEGAAGQGPIFSSQVWTLPDSVVAQAAEDFGFTPGANPSYSAPVDPLTLVDTVSNTIDGVTYENIYNYGDLGQPLLISVTRAGVLFATTRYVWVSPSSGGVQLSSVRVEDYSQPDVLVMTSISAESGRLVILSGGGLPGPTAGTLDPPLSEATGTLGTFGQLPALAASVGPLLSSCAVALADALAPTPLYAQQGSCQDAWAKFGLAAGGVAYWTFWVVATPNPITIGGYVLSLGNLAKRGVAVGKACYLR